MAWWNTQLYFLDDQLVAEGIDPIALEEYDTVILSQPVAEDSQSAAPAQDSPPALPESVNSYTRVIVSGYALYGELRGYYALGVAHWQVDPATRRIFMTERSQRDQEPVSSLTPAQRAILRECLSQLNPQAWDTSTGTFRRQLEC